MAASKRLVLASVVDVHPGPVTYPACSSCYTKLQLQCEVNKVHCARCQKLYEPSEIQHRYRLHLTVADQETCREVTIFGSCLDVYFGTDATTFSSCLTHAGQHHHTVKKEDILEESLKEALIGHPFYFGFKSLGYFSTCSKLNGTSTDSCFSLANLGHADENPIAVQMISPLQKWTFPTVMQHLIGNIVSLEASCDENRRDGMCIVEGQSTCPFMQFEQMRMMLNPACLHMVGHSAHGKESVGNKSAVISSGSSTTGKCSSLGESSSTLGGMTMSVNMPSLRLSCDEYSITRSTLYCERELANLSNSSPDVTKAENPRLRKESPGSHKTLQTPEMKTIRHNVTETRDSCEDEIVIQGIRPTCKPERCCPVGVKFDGSKKDNLARDRELLINGAKCRNGTPLSQVGVDCNDLADRGSESYMDHWLQDTSYDNWSNAEYLPSVNGSDHDIEDKNYTEVPFQGKREERITARQRVASAGDESTNYDFSEDLPFSEDLDQFLQDVEEDYVLTKGIEVYSSLSSHSKPARKLVTSRESRKGPISTCGNMRRSMSDSQLEMAKRQDQPTAKELYISGDREKCDVDSSPHYIKNIKNNCKPVLLTSSKECTDQRRNEVEMTYKQGAGNPEGADVLLDDKVMGLVVHVKRKEIGHNVIVGENDRKGRERHRGKKLQVDEVIDRTKSACTEESSDFASDTEIDVIPESPNFIACSQSPDLFSQSQSFCLSLESSKISPKGFHRRSVPRTKLSLERYSRIDCTDPVARPSVSSNSFAKQAARTSGRKANLAGLHRTRMEIIDKEDSSTPKIQDGGDENAPKIVQSSPPNTPYLVHSPNRAPNCINSPEGTPALFSQANDVEFYTQSQRSAVFSGRPTRVSCHKKKLAPLRELFLQRARSWKMSSTPRTIAMDDNFGERMDSPALFGTPDLFSEEDSPNRDDVFGQPINKITSNESQMTETADVFECTPDLF